jgi:hypothetical protein
MLDNRLTSLCRGTAAAEDNQMQEESSVLEAITAFVQAKLRVDFGFVEVWVPQVNAVAHRTQHLTNRQPYLNSCIHTYTDMYVKHILKTRLTAMPAGHRTKRTTKPSAQC